MPGATGFWQRLLRRNAAPPLRIVLRQSPDWRSTPYQELIEGSRAFCRMVSGATGIGENFIADVVAVWDRTFALPYFAVRAAMKDIAAENLATVANAQCSADAHAPLPSSTELVAFIDDDDWLHPHMHAAIAAARSADGDGDGYLFGNVLCASRVELRRIEDGCYTNNYAVAADFLRRDARHAGDVLQHWDANAVFHREDFRCVRVARYLSATNKHPASTMKLKDGLQQSPLCAATLKELIVRYLDESAAVSMPDEAAWAAPYAKKTRDVLVQLL